MPPIEEPRLLYEKSHFSPEDASIPTTAEFWFVNQSPHQKIHLSLTHSPTSSLENDILSSCRTDFHSTTLKLIELITPHLRKIGPVIHHRFSLLLKNGVLSDKPSSPPALSENAIAAPPDIPRVKLSDIKFLETREIRKNVRIVKYDERKCLYKSVSYEGEALALSFEVSNYKTLLEKGLGTWIPELIGLVYVVDQHDDTAGESLTRKRSNTSSSAIAEEDEKEADDDDDDDDGVERSEDDPHHRYIHYVGALFQYFSQRDLTNHYATAPINAKLSWMRQLVQAIAAFEAAGFEHWDLKCENIVIDTSFEIPTPDHEIEVKMPTSPGSAPKRRMSNVKPSYDNPGRVKVIDLENSKASPAWQPPERAGPAGRRGSKINISQSYALGKTVLEIFLGKVPAEGKVEERHVEGLPDVAKVIVRSCCETEDGEWVSVQEVLRRLEELERRKL